MGPEDTPFVPAVDLEAIRNFGGAFPRLDDEQRPRLRELREVRAAQPAATSLSWAETAHLADDSIPHNARWSLRPRDSSARN